MTNKERIIKELFGKGRWTFGGDGSHWKGCEESHWDCKLVALSIEVENCHRLIQVLERDKIQSKSEVRRVHAQLDLDAPDWDD